MNRRDKMAAKYGKKHTVLWTLLSSVKVLFKFLSLPVLRDYHPWISYKKNHGTILPINQELYIDNVPLAVPIIDEFIEKSTHRFILDVCGCRRAFECENHPQDLGCIFLGQSSMDISPGLGHSATKDEARGHVQRAIGLGLVPSMGKVRVDNFFFDTPDIGKLMSLCFCCHCCCMGSFYKTLPIDHLNKMSPQIEGLAIEVTDKCNGCGTCTEYCVFGAITVEDGRAIHSDYCRGCGRCVTNCPEKAVKISLNNPNFKEEVVNRINSIVDVS